MKKFKKFGLGALAIFGSMLLIMCGPSGMSMIGDAMVDVGHTLSDSGRDATSDAAAQDCATSCTSAGVQRIMTADSDPAQLVTGSILLSAASGATPGHEVIAGPLVLTDALIYRNGALADVSIFVSEHCDETAPSGGRAWVGLLTSYQGANGGGAVYFHNDLTGIRVNIPDGSFLCAYSTGGGTALRYAGFRPYN